MKFNKTVCSLCASALLLSGSAFALDSTEISNGLNDFAKQLLVVIPESSTQQNVWADAYIGKVFPSLPPHFGGGITIGGTQLDMTGFKTAADGLISNYNTVTQSLSTLTSIAGITTDKLDFGTIPDTFFMPTASVDVRIGGFVLPFDIGLCAMMTNPSLFSVDLSNPDSIMDMSSPLTFSAFGYDGTFDYLTIGADIRYAVFEGNLVLPTISVGGGYYFTKGEFGASSSSETTIQGAGVQTTTANIDMSFKTQVFFLQVEASKSFAIVTVYGGLRGILSNSTDSWAWSYSTSNDSITTLSASESDSGTVASGSDPSSVYNDGTWDFSAIQPQLFGGVGFNFVVFQTTLGVCWDMRNSLWSGSFAFHVKI